MWPGGSRGGRCRRIGDLAHGVFFSQGQDHPHFSFLFSFLLIPLGCGHAAAPGFLCSLSCSSPSHIHLPRLGSHTLLYFFSPFHFSWPFCTRVELWRAKTTCRLPVCLRVCLATKFLFGLWSKNTLVDHCAAGPGLPNRQSVCFYFLQIPHELCCR